MASFERDKIESNANPRNMNSSDNGTESTHTFISSLVINLSLSLLMITLFSILRPRLKRIYAPRQILLEMIFPLGKLPHSFFAWIIPAFVANDDDVFYYAGIDALVYMRFLKLCIKISFLIFPYGIAVLLPLNCYGIADLSGLDKLSMSNLGQRSGRLWAHLVAAWVYTLIICYLLYLEWKIYIMYRQEYLSNGKSHQYAVLVRDVPRKFQNEQSMKSYIEDLFPNQIEDVIVIEDLSIWQRLIEKHDGLVLKLEHSKVIYEKSGKRPTHRTYLYCTELDSITQYEQDLMELQQQLEIDINQEHLPLPCAFVIFRSLRMATTAMQVNWSNCALGLNVTPAPEVSNVIWANLSKGLWKRKFCTTLVYGATFLLVFFYLPPITFISALFALENIANVLHFLRPVLEYSTFVRGIIEGFLSSVTLWVFFAILPWILRKLTQQEGITSRSEVDISVLGKLFIFMVINKFLFLTAGSAALTMLNEILKHPREIPRYLAQSLPGQSTFFICYIMLRSFVGFSMELLRIVDLIVIPIRRKWFSHTPREDEAAWRPPPVAYDSLFTDHLFVLIVGMSYSVIAPIITPFVVFYFGFGYVVWMYQIMCVYIPVYSCGGLMWPKVFNRIIVGMIVFHLLMIGELSLKESYFTSAAMVPLPIVTILFFLFIQQHFLTTSKYLSLNMASGVAEASPHFLQEVARRYVRNHSLPPTYGYSSLCYDAGHVYDFEDISTDTSTLGRSRRASWNEELP